MSRLDYIHDTLYWDDKPVNELNHTERGNMSEYINSLPDEWDLAELSAYDQLQKDIKDEYDSYRKSMKKLIADPDITKEDLLEGFIDVLQSFIE